MAYITVYLDQFDDDDIRQEYESRGLGDKPSDDATDDATDEEALTKIWIADREGRKDEAYALMREYVLDKLHKVV